jgi:hypothetical protein
MIEEGMVLVRHHQLLYPQLLYKKAMVKHLRVMLNPQNQVAKVNIDLAMDGLVMMTTWTLFIFRFHNYLDI